MLTGDIGETARLAKTQSTLCRQPHAVSARQIYVSDSRTAVPKQFGIVSVRSSRPKLLSSKQSTMEFVLNFTELLIARNSIAVICATFLRNFRNWPEFDLHEDLILDGEIVAFGTEENSRSLICNDAWGGSALSIFSKPRISQSSYWCLICSG